MRCKNGAALARRLRPGGTPRTVAGCDSSGGSPSHHARDLPKGISWSDSSRWQRLHREGDQNRCKAGSEPVSRSCAREASERHNM